MSRSTSTSPSRRCSRSSTTSPTPRCSQPRSSRVTSVRSRRGRGPAGRVHGAEPSGRVVAASSEHVEHACRRGAPWRTRRPVGHRDHSRRVSSWRRSRRDAGGRDDRRGRCRSRYVAGPRHRAVARTLAPSRCASSLGRVRATEQRLETTALTPCAHAPSRSRGDCLPQLLARDASDSTSTRSSLPWNIVA